MKIKSGLLTSLFLLLIFAGLASGHRLDEYLQATTISLEKTQITVQMRLTPGVQVFSKVLKIIDTDGDGILNESEKQAYAQRVAADLSLTLDDKRLPLRSLSTTFPEIQDMKEGQGDIVLRYAADVSPGGFNRTLIFQNHHQQPISVFLANCLVPRDTDLQVITQDRNLSQTFYRISYTQAGSGGASATASTAAPQQSAAGQIDTTGNRSMFRAYIYEGIHHILTGYDHLLFVSALVLAATTLWDLVKVVSTFTLAHTITLTLAALNVVHLPGRVVEPFISASIVVVALQNVFWPRRARGWPRLAAAFFFGLFHGLGFAGGLLEAMQQMPSSTMLLAILAFSIGVEAGHQMVVLPLFAILKTARGLQSDAVARTRISMAMQRFGSAGISAAGVYYLCLALTGRS